MIYKNPLHRLRKGFLICSKIWEETFRNADKRFMIRVDNIAISPLKRDSIWFVSYRFLLVWYDSIIAYILAFVQYRKPIVVDSRNLLCFASFLYGIQFIYIRFPLCFHDFCIETPAMKWYNGINPHEEGGREPCAVTAGFSRFVRC